LVRGIEDYLRRRVGFVTGRPDDGVMRAARLIAGWPSCGVPVGAAVPSRSNAAAYFVAFERWARRAAVKSFYFEAFDEAWKATYEGAAGACLGVADAAGALKPGFAAGLGRAG
jgi:hypothetical protein